MQTRRSVHRTQWAAQFAVASELCKRDYEVAFTMGNHPNVDLLVVSPTDVPFGIDVKGLYKRNFWAVKAKLPRPNLFYVLAYVPDVGPNRFFILDQMAINAEIDLVIERAKGRAAAQGRSADKADAFTGVSWAFAERYEDNWAILPA